jgi:tryptophan 2,3-dioxygenase
LRVQKRLNNVHYFLCCKNALHYARVMSSYTNIQQILNRLEQREQSTVPILAMGDEEALRLLHQKHLSDGEIDSKLDQLTLNGERATTRVLASYPDLHALNRLDEAKQGIDLSENPKAGNLRAVLQATEIALLNTRDVSDKIVADIEDGNIGGAEEKYRWVSSFQQTLHSLSLLAAKLPSGRGASVSIADSSMSGKALDGLKHVHHAITNAGYSDPEQINRHNIHESGRNLSHQAFVDTTYTELWKNSLQNLVIPDVAVAGGEDKRAFYERFVGTNALNLAVNELDQKGDNFFRQFRAYHQMSEILVSQVNLLIGQSIKTILNPKGNLLQATEDMGVALEMLEIVNQNIVPILRNLSVNQYQEIRGSLGITSGSHSPNIKQGLFAPLYELFTEAVKFRIMDLKPHTEENLKQRMSEIVSSPTQDHTTHDLYTLMKQANELYSTLHTWRELHMQFVKTQIGMPSHLMQPTASISGATNAMHSAHGMNRKAHGDSDPILPIYETLLGREFVAVSPFAKAFGQQGEEETFAQTMMKHTATVVAERSAGVQERVLRK